MTPILHRYVAGTLLEITYGQRLTSMNDLIVQLAERTVVATNESGSPGSMLVDFFPIRAFAGNRAEIQYVLISYGAPPFVPRSEASADVAARRGVQEARVEST